MTHFAYVAVHGAKSAPRGLSVYGCGVDRLGLRGGRQADADRDRRTGGGAGAGNGGTSGTAGARRQRRRPRRLRRHRHQSGRRRAASRGASPSSRRSRPSTWWSTARAACSTASARPPSTSAPTRRTRRGPSSRTPSQSVVTQLEEDVRFGFTTIFGTEPATAGRDVPAHHGTLADNVPPALNNAGAIKTEVRRSRLAARADIIDQRKKFEIAGDVRDAAAAAKALMADTTPGDKYILFLTDGQEDYCDDALRSVASDSTVGALQTAFAANIRTIVFGLQTHAVQSAGGRPGGFANAGAGEPTVAPCAPASTRPRSSTSARASTRPGATDLTASGHPTTRGPTRGGGDVRARRRARPSPSSRTPPTRHMLVTQLSTRAGGRQELHVRPQRHGGTDQGRPQSAQQGVGHDRRHPVPLDPNSANGWNMTTDTSCELFGSACDAWRNPNAKNIAFNFPCEIIVE